MKSLFSLRPKGISSIIFIIDWLSLFLTRIAAVIVVGVTFLILVHVIFRYALRAPLSFTEEISAYGAAAITFLGLAFTLKSGGHVRVEMLYNRFKKKLDPVVGILGLAWAVPLFWSAWVQWFEFFDTGEKGVTLLRVPQWIVFTPILIGCAMLLVQLLVEIVRSKRSNR